MTHWASLSDDKSTTTAATVTPQAAIEEALQNPALSVVILAISGVTLYIIVKMMAQLSSYFGGSKKPTATTGNNAFFPLLIPLLIALLDII